MDEFLQSFWFWVCTVAAACYVLTLLTRRFVDAAIARMREPERLTYWWREVALYVVGPLWGLGLCLYLRDTSSFPAAFQEREAAAIFGLALGFSCGWFYKLLKKLIVQRAGVELFEEKHELEEKAEEKVKQRPKRKKTSSRA